MRKNPYFELDDRDTIERLIRENPWAMLVSGSSEGLVAPILDELEGDRPYASPELAREMKLAHGDDAEQSQA